MAQHLSDMELDEAIRRVRVNSRRRQILDAAIAVMQRTGFHQMSMQALADKAGISVGLIYKYYASKHDILLATILDILDAFSDQLEPAMDAVGNDPVIRFAAGFRRYMEVVDENREAVVLTYRESRTLDHAGRERIKALEIATAQPLRDAIEAGKAQGMMANEDIDLAVFNVKVLAHNWALKQWYVGPKFSIDAYIDAQLRFVLGTLVVPERRDAYAYLAGSTTYGVQTSER